MKVLLDLIPVTPAMQAEFFIRENIWIIAGAIVLAAVAAAVLIIKTIKKKK